MTLLRRSVLVLALMVWQGGFMFYGAVVVPTGSSVLGSDREQGFVTKAVTNYLNIAGGVALTIWAWDIATEPAGRKRWAGWVALVGILVLLAWLHVRMDLLLDLDELKIRDGLRFRELHRVYLSASTVQWAASLILFAWTLLVWRRQPAK